MCLTALIPHCFMLQADVSGWTLVRADRAPSDGWQLPAGTKIAAAGTLLVLCPRNRRKRQAAAWWDAARCQNLWGLTACV
jgi:hypothetical protein